MVGQTERALCLADLYSEWSEGIEVDSELCASERFALGWGLKESLLPEVARVSQGKVQPLLKARPTARVFQWSPEDVPSHGSQGTKGDFADELADDFADDYADDFAGDYADDYADDLEDDSVNDSVNDSVDDSADDDFGGDFESFLVDDSESEPEEAAVAYPPNEA